ncbi:MAG: hypothetical protein WAW42_02690 [Candidatus Competibacteraceae bacterium]
MAGKSGGGLRWVGLRHPDVYDQWWCLAWDSRLRAKWQGRSAATADWMLSRWVRTRADFRPDLVIVAGVFGVPLDDLGL